MPFEKITIQILFIIDSILLQFDSGHRFAANCRILSNNELFATCYLTARRFNVGVRVGVPRFLLVPVGGR